MFSVHVKNTLIVANKCLYVLRTLRREGYSQPEIDKLFSTLVMTKVVFIIYGEGGQAKFTRLLSYLGGSERFNSGSGEEGGGGGTKKV